MGSGLSPFDQIVSLGVFKDVLRSVVHRAKYERMWSLAERLADRLAERADAAEMLDYCDVMVPVPLHPTRHFERGYNQAEVIARRICWRFHQRADRRLGSANSQSSLFDARNSAWRFPKILDRFRKRGLKVVKAAERIRATESQTYLPSHAGRYENMRDAFQLVDPDAIADKHIVLVDDVTTSGATLVSLARTIKIGKPRCISALVLAVADPKGRSFEVA
jgi:predicted amidophosphoribosyltransferase